MLLFWLCSAWRLCFFRHSFKPGASHRRESFGRAGTAPCCTSGRSSLRPTLRGGRECCLRRGMPQGCRHRRGRASGRPNGLRRVWHPLLPPVDASRLCTPCIATLLVLTGWGGRCYGLLCGSRPGGGWRPARFFLLFFFLLAPL